MSGFARHLALGIGAFLLALSGAPASATALDGSGKGAELNAHLSLEGQILQRINFARQHPREYADQLRELRLYFDGQILYMPDDPYGLITNEGVAAIDEAIDFLERQRPLPALSQGELLALAANDHAIEQGPIGGRGHLSPDGASPGERVRRHGGDIYVGEGISYGYDQADAVVRQLIVDDGVADRGHRRLLFNGDFRYAGVACGGHRQYQHMCVVDMSATINGAPMLPAQYASRGQVFTMPGGRR